MKNIYIFLFTLFTTAYLNAQLEINTIGAPVLIDFTGFTGSGFQPGGGAGLLNSDDWSVLGCSDGDLDFGGTVLSGDLAKGSTGGLVISGGIYGVDIAGNQGLMVQPTADDFTPGSFILKLINNTGSEIGQLDIAYTIYVLNDAGRANSFNFSYSFDNVVYTDIPALNYTSPEAIDFTPYLTIQSTSLIGLAIPDGNLFFIRWTSDDVSGGGSRDEFAIDDISITPIEGLPLVLATFNPAGAFADESAGMAIATIELTESTDCLLDISVNPSSTADITDVPFVPFGLLLSPGDPTTYEFNISINEDLIVEGDETFILDLTYVSGTCAVGLPSSFTLVITDNDIAPPPVYTVYDIADVILEDVDGVAISDGEFVDLTGIVYGVNTWDGGLQFTLIDATGGINVFSFSSTFGYTVAEGDEVNIQGIITQFNGLIEVEPDTLFYIDGGNTLKTPTLVSDLNENTESDLIRLEQSLALVDPLQWLGDGSSFNVDVTDGTNIWVMRIDDNTELSTTAYSTIFPPNDYALTLTGIGSQYDASTPFNEGYEILPRYNSDLEVVFVPESIEVVSFLIKIYPNPTLEQLTFSSKEFIQSIEIINNLGQSINEFSIYDCSKTINVQNLPAGIYHLKIKTDSGLYTSNFIKQ